MTVQANNGIQHPASDGSNRFLISIALIAHARRSVQFHYATVDAGDETAAAKLSDGVVSCCDGRRAGNYTPLKIMTYPRRQHIHPIELHPKAFLASAGFSPSMVIRIAAGPPHAEAPSNGRKENVEGVSAVKN